MGRWGDETDPEVLNYEEPKGRISINFKKIWVDIDRIVDGTANVSDKHPKDELIKEWIGIMLGFLILFLLSYKLFAFVTIPFMAFYVIGLCKLIKAWKHFGYKILLPVILTIITLAALFALAIFVQRFYNL